MFPVRAAAGGNAGICWLRLSVWWDREPPRFGQPPGDGAAWPLSVAVTGAFVVGTPARPGEVLRKQGPPRSQRCREAGAPSSPTHLAWGGSLQVHEM